VSALTSVSSQGGVTDAILAAARPLFAAAIWAYFDAHQSDVLFSKWGIVKIRLGDLRPLIEALAGPDTGVST
jgi:hypothetical protein